MKGKEPGRGLIYESIRDPSCFRSIDEEQSGSVVTLKEQDMLRYSMFRRCSHPAFHFHVVGTVILGKVESDLLRNLHLERCGNIDLANSMVDTCLEVGITRPRTTVQN